jgi:glutaminyl-tRNA synthetase
MVDTPASPPRRTHFLTDVIDADLAAHKVQRIATRFPPEPNGYLHIGHAKSICLNFGLARDYHGTCNLRMDDTNPVTEDTDYVRSIQEDVRWLGFQWTQEVRYASDYFERMYELAVRLVQTGKAYVDHQSVEQIREGRGDFGRPGSESPFRDRSVEENLRLFEAMRSGTLPDGTCVLRARIDMAHPNVLMRDPLLYRIRHAHHHRSGDTWCIYPMYDYAHPIEDAIEGITHSICTLEFESNRELYDWVMEATGPWQPRPRQYEFARLALGYTLMSKRKLLLLVQEGIVNGWDDPRMPTIAGMRRRGVTPEALRDFADLIGVAKNNSLVDMGKLEFCIRQDLEKRAPRAMAVLKPLKVELTNWSGPLEWLELPWWPNEPGRGTRKVPFGREILIEQDDFALEPAADWKRWAPGREVRLLGAYFLRCDDVLQDEQGHVTGLRASVDLTTRGGEAQDGRTPAGTLHWVEATHAAPAEIRLYDRLFRVEQPDGDDFRKHLNPESLVVCGDARVEPALAGAEPGSRFQFVRQGWFSIDPASVGKSLVINRIIGLRDAWSKTARTDGRPERKKAEAKVNPAHVASSPKKSRAEHRAELRISRPELADRFARYQQLPGLSTEDADALSVDDDLARYFEAALSVHPQPGSVARWLLNELAGLTKDRSLGDLPLDGRGFGRFVQLVDDGRVTASGGKTLLAHLVQNGGEPDQSVETLGLGKVEDAGALAAGVQAVLNAHPAEVARYRAGEHKLIGVFVGAALRHLKGADAAAVRQAILTKLA